MAAAHGEQATKDEFPCKLTIYMPFPDNRLARIAINSLQVDKELSPFVSRHFELVSADVAEANQAVSQQHKPNDINGTTNDTPTESSTSDSLTKDKIVLKVIYAATTNRMLRVSSNGFFESIQLVIQCMEDLDVDVVMKEGKQDLTAVQGLADLKSVDS